MNNKMEYEIKNDMTVVYFFGEIFAEGSPRQICMEKTKDNAFEIDYRLVYR